MGNRIGVAALVAALGISAVTPVAAAQEPSSGAYQTSWNRGLSGWTHSGAGWSASKGVVTYDGSSASVLIAPYKVKSSRYSVTATMRLIAWRETGVSESHGMGILIRARGAVDPTGGTAGLMAGIGKGFVGCDGVHSNAVLATADSDFTTVGQDQRAFSAGHAWHTFRVDVNGNEVKLSIDGRTRVTATTKRLVGGTSLGLFSLSARAQLKHFAVTQH